MCVPFLLVVLRVIRSGGDHPVQLSTSDATKYAERPHVTPTG
jgi:hypothetical protein